ncbi:hypothetical protein LO80_03260 [Candidatus Francisella endociliophora]|uniref:Uncharacterized protein n=1 Tax=Candidatus Francisella endociliophora TaxID=653937 RepID=A0A097ENE4_9GAMM|nr:hypothetical protein [Francisella sp. FSC1006]AIT09086.1 hypothetical protein LO80_03260 [Francisella sp. FSC1006]
MTSKNPNLNLYQAGKPPRKFDTLLAFNEFTDGSSNTVENSITNVVSAQQTTNAVDFMGGKPQRIIAEVIRTKADDGDEVYTIEVHGNIVNVDTGATSTKLLYDKFIASGLVNQDRVVAYIDPYEVAGLVGEDEEIESIYLVIKPTGTSPEMISSFFLTEV